MKKIIGSLLLLFFTTGLFAQINYSEKLSYSPPKKTEGPSFSCTVKITTEVTENGIQFWYKYRDYMLIRKLRIKGKEIMASMLPIDVVEGMKKALQLNISYDIYQGETFIARRGFANQGDVISWATLQNLNDTENDKLSTKENGLKLYQSGTLKIRNVRIENATRYSDFVAYRKFYNDFKP